MTTDQDPRDSPASRATADPTFVELIEELDDLESDVESRDARAELHETQELLRYATDRGLIDSGIRRLQPRDIAEAALGCIVLSTPLLVEDGIFDIADFLFGFTVRGVPVFLLANTVFVVLMTYALVEWTGQERSEHNRFLDLFSVRVLMILAVSFAISTLLMTVWGRVGNWDSPGVAFARITVLWTVGSLGAALGDIIAGDDKPFQSANNTPSSPSRHSSHRAGDAPPALDEGALLDAIHEQFDTLQDLVDDTGVHRDLDRIKTHTMHAATSELFGTRIRKYTSRDIAEAFVGSVFFAIPLLVEDGVFDVAAYFLAFRLGRFPVFFLLNTVFVVLVVAALLYWTGPQDVRVSRPLFGIIPRRLLGITLVSFLTAAFLMTMWGRVDNWADPTVAIARISAVWTVAALGAALGDILPGESSGDDINDDLADLGETFADRLD